MNNLKKFINIVIITILLVGCSEHGEPIQFDKLGLDISHLEMMIKTTKSIKIVGGSGKYSIKTNDKMLSVQPLGNSLNITSLLTAGTTELDLTDENTKETVKITVKIIERLKKENLSQIEGAEEINIGMTLSIPGEEVSIGFPITLSPFRMSKYEVTNWEYAQFLTANRGITGLYKGEEVYYTKIDDEGELYKGDDIYIEQVGNVYRAKKGFEKHPMVHVTWFGAEAYAKWVGGRLPTEAEWEFSARGGKTAIDNGTFNQKYAGTDDDDKVKDYAWFNENSMETTGEGGISSQSTNEYDGKGSHPVGTKKPNELGLYDMTGNVMEWSNDWYQFQYPSGDFNPVGAVSGKARTISGGAWVSTKSTLSLKSRASMLSPKSTSSIIGFRVIYVKDIK